MHVILLGMIYYVISLDVMFLELYCVYKYFY